MSSGCPGCLPAEPPSWSATTVVCQGNLGGVTVEEEAPAAQPTPAPHKVNKQNRYVKSNPDLYLKGERQSLPSMEQEVTGTTGSIKPASHPQPGRNTLSRRLLLYGLSLKRNRKRHTSTSALTEEEQEKGEVSTCSEEGNPQEGKAVATHARQRPQAKGAEASAASKGEETEETGPQAAEPSTPFGLNSGPTPMSKQNE
uniref:Uncharacterized protein n=1 Tax=Catagonus wagneri TaxID=51154 RepID=A0A8C3YCY9_9CETA